ncbi:hypothetical protein STCU_05787 [Strigomonas culicis]|uniref:adenylate cyclase n=2 Tax=Strigomonas culicis TaxID=28005 RepID=S9VJV4_9TRYP|nr:hypothetical protein STCU_05787 [Strigomonas culicis]|eukprot:EPY27366.1 hypothetical protein STCU_05787 [Strigomonas culicis]
MNQVSDNSALASGFVDAVFTEARRAFAYDFTSYFETPTDIDGYTLSPLSNYPRNSALSFWYTSSLDSRVSVSTAHSPVPEFDEAFIAKTTTTTTTTKAPTTTTTATPNDTAPIQSSKMKIVVGAVVASCMVVAVVLTLIVLFCTGTIGGNARDNRNAPKETDSESATVTIVFTDIESSTALWSAVPKEMSEAVSRHHRMIRQLIVRYKCYEVKTIGDSFMIACGDAYTAVQLVADLQRVFMECDWGTSALDETYRMLRRQKKSDDTAEDTPGAWNGLRVRVGVHTGVCECRYDQVMKGYDYYGDAVNTAARTESLGCGGQVLLTEATRAALTEEQLALTPMTPLGPQYLRGVSGTIDLYQLDTVGGRLFPPLVTKPPEEGAEVPVRKEVEPKDDHRGDVMNVLTATEAEEREVPLNTEPVAEVLDVYFSPFTARQKTKLLRMACKQLSLQKPPRAAFATEEAYAQALIHILATRTAQVIEFRRQLRVAASAPEDPSPQEKDTASVVLLMDNGELLQLGGAQKVRRNPLSASQRAASATVGRRRSHVTFTSERACYDTGSGTLFELHNEDTQQMAFYNDTKHLVVRVTAVMSDDSEVRPLGRTALMPLEGKRRLEAVLCVQPQETALFLEGTMRAYKLSYKVFDWT